MKNHIIVLIGLIILLVLVGLFTKPYRPAPAEQAQITNFDECVAAGNPVMKSYPAKCAAGDQVFTQGIASVDVSDSVRVSNIKEGNVISSPVTVKGEARGTWYFEASFPITVTDADGKVIGEGHAQAIGDWMTTEFVPFSGTITFNAASSTTSDRGYLIIRKDNPSGLPQNDASLKIAVVLK